MNGKWKVLILVGVLVFISGFVISVKHFQLTEDFRRLVQQQKSLEISTWVSELLVQKVGVLESSVSHLDKSTTEIMKRQGVQYFAYAHKNAAGKWKVKWKTLGEIETPKIKEQVAGFSFDDFSLTKRTWVRLGKNTVLVSPVANADSQKMKSGYLIFSLEAQRLEKLGALSSEFALFSHNGDSLNAKNPKWLEVENLFMGKKDGAMAIVENRDTTYLRAATFHSALQMWVVHFQPFSEPTYITSASAITFFLSFLILGLLGGFLTYRLPLENLGIFKSSDSRATAGVGESDAVLRVVLHRMRNDMNALREKVGSMAEPVKKLDVVAAIDSRKDWLGVSDTKSTKEVSDFGKCIEVITLLKQGELAKAGISVQTQIEDGAAVVCSIEAVEEFLLRLVDNSIATLAGEDEKWIHLACTKQGKYYQFVYRDSRSGEIPQRLDDAQLLTSDNPFEDIHGILAFGHFAFGAHMTSSQDELNIGLKLLVDEPTTTILPRDETEPSVSTKTSVASMPVATTVEAPITEAPTSQAMPGDVAYEIDIDTEYELEDIEILQPLPNRRTTEASGPEASATVSSGDEDGFQSVDFPVETASSDSQVTTSAPTQGFLVPPPLPTTATPSTPPVNTEVETMVKDFELKEFNFDDTLPDMPEAEDVAFSDTAEEAPIASSSQDGLVEFAAGDMKLKIRSPKKRTPNVSS